MELIDIAPANQKLFFTCLCPDEKGWGRVVRERSRWYQEFRDKGYEAKVLLNDNAEIVGKCHYIPVEYSPLIGKDLLVILCLYVQMHNNIGDQRGKGYGRFMLREIEKIARIKGFGGVATWAMDWHWNPMSFYTHMGYLEVDRIDKAVVLWKPFREILPPRFIRLHPFMQNKEKVSVVVSDNAWCNGNEKLRVAREAVKGLKGKVDYYETICPFKGRMLHLGYVGGIFLNGNPYKPYELVGEPEELRETILKIYKNKFQSAPD
jgi:GNAT superfamily N-acetyltransferase